MEIILDFFFFIFALIVSLFDLATSDTDYHMHTIENQTAFIQEYDEEFDEIIDWAFKLVPNSGERPTGSTTLSIIDSKTNKNLKKIKQRFKDRISVGYTEDGAYIRFDLTGPTPGFGNCEWYYFTDEPIINIFYDYEIKYEDGKKIYCLYNPANYKEYRQIDDHWYFAQTAYVNYSGFKQKEN